MYTLLTLAWSFTSTLRKKYKFCPLLREIPLLPDTLLPDATVLASHNLVKCFWAWIPLDSRKSWEDYFQIIYKNWRFWKYTKGQGLAFGEHSSWALKWASNNKLSLAVLVALSKYFESLLRYGPWSLGPQMVKNKDLNPEASILASPPKKVFIRKGLIRVPPGPPTWV